MSAFDFDVVTGPAIPVAPRRTLPETAREAPAAPRPESLPPTVRAARIALAPVPVDHAASIVPSR